MKRNTGPGAAGVRASACLLAVVLLVISVVTAGAVGELNESCTTHCDCLQGEYCYYGTCVRDPTTPVYCCAKPGCMPGRWCYNPDGSKGDCGENSEYQCETACDC